MNGYSNKATWKLAMEINADPVVTRQVDKAFAELNDADIELAEKIIHRAFDMLSINDRFYNEIIKAKISGDINYPEIARYYLNDNGL